VHRAQEAKSGIDGLAIARVHANNRAGHVGPATYYRPMTSPTRSVLPGETIVREQIHGPYGGNAQAGITRSSSTPNVLVYSDHEKAGANGYDFDGWDESQQVYYYTGEGKVGDQQMARGNKAIADHQADGTALRLFIAVGSQPGSDTRIHHYVGQFADLSRETLCHSHSTDGVPWNVFVFRLVSVGPIVTEDNPQTSRSRGRTRQQTSPLSRLTQSRSLPSTQSSESRAFVTGLSRSAR
jgi:hypothetical protein